MTTTTSAESLTICMTGLPGTGKSTLSRALARKLGLELLSTAEVRHDWDLEINTLATRLATWQNAYAELIARANKQLFAKRSIVIDGTFGRHWQREQLYQLLSSHPTELVFVETHCSDAAALARIERDTEQRPAEVEWRVRDDYFHQVANWHLVTVEEVSSVGASIVRINTESTEVQSAGRVTSTTEQVLRAVLVAVGHGSR